MSPRVGSVPWRRLAPLGVGALLLVPAVPGASAQAPGLPDVLGEWTQPFEEGGAGVPRCVPAEDGTPDDTSAHDGDMFCADLMSLPDGRVLIVGGTDWYNEPALIDRNEGDPVDAGLIELEGLRNARLFDPATDSFSAAGHMKYGRWYPTLVELPDGTGASGPGSPGRRPAWPTESA